ncbi:serine--tRNA ligase [Malassezia vespertilionis]|uniref:serine--tRNA ligase n=1 Tax=Malassezia vespertilionis TaxID=2020962 RepID=A0A2N1JB59_9BASI|nr:serine--tRNA ligase [Malassezia vespertilionis]PKI83774.1 Dia4p [Malassezia vespertilionis]WFD07361.1 serine--tRNA ligase [Malassezia vespertilionis]
MLRWTPRPVLRAGWRGVRHAASSPPFRPLPDMSVAWTAAPDDIAAARQSAQERKMRFHEADAAGLAALHAELAALRKQIHALEAAQREAGSTIQKSAKLAQSDPASHAALEAAREEARLLRTQLRAASRTIDELHARSLAVRSAWPNRIHAVSPRGDERCNTVVGLHDARPTALQTPLVVPSLPCTQEALDTNEAMQKALKRDPARDHLVLADALRDGGLDIAAGISTTGPSWPYMLGTLSLLEHALANYALSIAIKHHFTPVSVPDVVKTEIAERCGFQPRDDAAAQTYFVRAREEEEARLCLAGTAEIPLAGLVAKRTFAARTSATCGVGGMALPVRLAALSHAFRAEAGARGADTRGLYRLHQFTKVEMFVVTGAEDSDAMLETLRAVQEEIVGGLGLQYRVLDMATEELGASAYRKYDIEAWMPGRGAWGEISSASNCTDFQARRLAIKYRAAGLGDEGKQPKLRYAHTLNATAAAIPRLILALLETYPTTDALALPSSLRPFWLGDAHVAWMDPAGKKGAPHAADGPQIVRHAHRLPRRGMHTAARRGAPRSFPRPKRRLFRLHTSARLHNTKDTYQARLRAVATRIGAEPGTLLLAFLLLHEFTAILPIFAFAALFALLGGGDALLHLVDTCSTAFDADTEAHPLRQKLASWSATGRRFGARLAQRTDAWLFGADDAKTHPTSAVWLSSIAAAYVLVKLLLPVRLALCFAWAPALATRFLHPLWRLVRRT